MDGEEKTDRRDYDQTYDVDQDTDRSQKVPESGNEKRK